MLTIVSSHGVLFFALFSMTPSDSVYHYDSEEHIFERAVTFESRVAEKEAVYETAAPEEIMKDTEEPGSRADTMTVLLIEPEQYPRKVEIGRELKDLQEAVGGYIQVTYPFDDLVGIVCNEEGKVDGLPLNRALRDDEGKIMDVIAGSFLVVGLTEDDFGSLSPELMQKYEEQFHQPEVFVHMGKGIMALPLPDEAIEARQVKAAEKERQGLTAEAPVRKPHNKQKENSL